MIKIKLYEKFYIVWFVFCGFLFFTLKLSCSYGQEYNDISGKWTIKFTGVEKECQEVSRNGSKEGTFVFKVIQNQDTIFAIFDDKITTNVVKGKITGRLIKITVKGVTSEDCTVETTLNGQIIGNDRIKGTYDGRASNCETCKWEGRFDVIVEK